MMTENGQPPSSAVSPKKREDEVRVTPLPKVIFFWPLWLVSILCVAFPADSVLAGQIWMGMFALNLLVIAVDFNEDRSMIAVLAVGVIILAALWLEWLDPLLGIIGGLKPKMNRTFYATIGGMFTLTYALVAVRARYNYWVFRPTEVVHYQGFFPKMQRYSTEQMRWQKEIPDVLERLLASSGRFVMTTPQEQYPIVIEHVVRINSRDEEIRRLLGVRRVVTDSSS